MSIIILIYRLRFLLIITILTSCGSEKMFNRTLQKSKIDIAITKPLEKPFGGFSVPAGIEIDSIFFPSGFPEQTFNHKEGFTIIPLLIYNRFTSRYRVTLGAKQFADPINEAFGKRFQALLTSCEVPSSNTIRNHYKISIELESCEVQGIYVYGEWTILLFSPNTFYVRNGKNTSALIRLKWKLQAADTILTTGDVLVSIKNNSKGEAEGFLVVNGSRRELIKEQMNWSTPYVVQYENDRAGNLAHLDQMVGNFCMSLDEASKVILEDIQNHFRMSRVPVTK